LLNYIFQRLAPLASLAAQRRWIVNGTPDEYLIPEQLLEDAFDAARLANLAHLKNGLPPGLFPALKLLAELAGRVNIEGTSNEVLVESDAAWGAVREQSQICLALVGFDLQEWEADSCIGSLGTERNNYDPNRCR